MSTAYLQLTNDTEDQQDLARIHQLQDLYQALAERYEFLGGIYIVSFSDKVGLTDSLLTKSMSSKRLNQRRDFLFSNPDMERLRDEFAQKAIKVEPNMKAYLENDYLIFRYEGDDDINKRCRKVLDKYGVRSRLFWRYHDESNPEFSANFFLMSDKHPDLLESQFADLKEELKEDLTNLHQMVFASRAVPHLNPLTGMGLVSDKGKKILELLATGHSRTEIGELLFLTDRGVDYHITKLKVLFNAKNNAHLVGAAYQYKILS